jgi:hypothetical protein
VEHGDVKKLTILTGCFVVAVTGTVAARMHRYDADAAMLLRRRPWTDAPEGGRSQDWSLWELEMRTDTHRRRAQHR